MTVTLPPNDVHPRSPEPGGGDRQPSIRESSSPRAKTTDTSMWEVSDLSQLCISTIYLLPVMGGQIRILGAKQLS